VYDLNKLEETNYCRNDACKIKDIDVGTSGDQVLVDSSGKIFLRTRLGGNAIYVYNQNSKEFDMIENENIAPEGIGMWPTGMGLSSDETRLYVLSHYAARIDVVDTATYEVIGSIQFNTELKPRTDSISSMVFDKSREKIYAVFPELGVIGIADGRNEKVLGMIDLTKYGFEKKANGGPGLVKLSVDEKTDTLSVLLTRAKTQLYFDGTRFEQKQGESDKFAGQLAYYNDKTGASGSFGKGMSINDKGL
jgi:DNA-binding beta-propeller fold protein YncE